MFGYLSRSKRSNLDVDEGGGHSGVVLSLVYFDSCITFHSGGKLTAVVVTDYLKRNILMHSLKNTVLLNVASRKKGEHLKTVLNNGYPKQTQLVSINFIYCFSKRKQYFGVG